MRFSWVIALALASCYKPVTDQPCELRCLAPDRTCPGALSCNGDGFCTDGRTCVPDDAPPIGDTPPDDDGDGPPATTCTLRPFGNGATASPLSTANHPSYTLDLGRTLAVFELNETGFTKTPDTVNPSAFQTMRANMAGALFHAPHLAPEGDEAFLAVDNSGTFSFVVSAFNGTTFETPKLLKVKAGAQELILGGENIPSTPTLRSLGTRRMAFGFSPNIHELAETMPGMEWTIIQTYTPDDFGLRFITEPSLSADGLHMVFVGQPPPDSPPQLIRIYGVTRASTADRFSMASVIELLEDGTEVNPFLTNDCSSLYYFRRQSMSVQRAGPIN